TSKHIRKTLPDSIVFSQTVNTDYEHMKVDIDRIHRAISEQKVLQYKYGDYNVHKEFQLRHNEKIYRVEPYALIWQNDLYYLIGRFLETNEIRHYRLDRMRYTEITDMTIKKDRHFQLQSYVDKSFQMFSGENIHLKIRLHNNLLNQIFDRFGLKVDELSIDEKHIIISK